MAVNTVHLCVLQCLRWWCLLRETTVPCQSHVRLWNLPSEPLQAASSLSSLLVVYPQQSQSPFLCFLSNLHSLLRPGSLRTTSAMKLIVLASSSRSGTQGSGESNVFFFLGTHPIGNCSAISISIRLTSEFGSFHMESELWFEGWDKGGGELGILGGNLGSEHTHNQSGEERRKPLGCKCFRCVH